MMARQRMSAIAEKVKSEKRATAAPADPAGELLGSLSTVELGKRHLSGNGVAAARAGLSTTSPAGIAAFDPDANSAPPLKRTKVNCRIDDTSGHPCYDCPECGAVHEQSVCPEKCHGCGLALKEGSKSTRGPRPAGAVKAPPSLPSGNGIDVRRGKLSEMLAESGPQTLDVPIDRITPSRHNPRKTFDGQGLAELAASIQQSGIIQRLVVRPECSRGRYELIAGERRWRAAKMAGLKTVPIEIREVTDKQAALLRLEENFRREDLNPIDQALAFQEATTIGGFTQQELADSLHLTQGAIANKIRLLKLPEAWRKKIISGEMSEKAARDLVPYAELPGVLDEAAKALGRGEADRMDPDDLRYELEGIAHEASRTMTDNKWRGDSPRFKVTPEIEKELDVRKVGKEKRAFNIALWDKLQGEADEKAERREAKASVEAKADPAKQKASAKKQHDIFAKQLYRWKIVWLQKRCAEELADEGVAEAICLKLLLHFTVAQSNHGRHEGLRKAVSAVGGRRKDCSDGFWRSLDGWKTAGSVDATKLWDVVSLALAEWVKHPAEGYRAHLAPSQIEDLAKELEVSIKDEWTIDREYLELHTADQLRALADEWGMTAAIESDVRRKDLIDSILVRAKEKAPKCPQELVKTKAVRL